MPHSWRPGPHPSRRGGGTTYVFQYRTVSRNARGGNRKTHRALSQNSSHNMNSKAISKKKLTNSNTSTNASTTAPVPSSPPKHPAPSFSLPKTQSRIPSPHGNPGHPNPHRPPQPTPPLVLTSDVNRKVNKPRKYRYEVGIWYNSVPNFLVFSWYFIMILNTIFIKFG